MKKTILILSLCVFISTISNAQLILTDLGNVGIQAGSTAPLSPLSIGGVGSANFKVSIYNNNYGLSVNRTGSSSISWLYGIYCSADLTSSYSLGIRSQTYSATPTGTGRSWGIMGYAGNSTSGYNYGVMGIHNGTANGAGIVGTVGGNVDVNVPGIYAGYFVGDVKVTGLVTSSNITSSDRRLKNNIQKINLNRNVLEGIQLLDPVEYNFKQRYIKTAGDTISTDKPYYDEKSQLFQKKQFGLIAQDVQLIYPDLVYQDPEGYLAINYTGLIPLLIESIKELKAEVDELKKNTTPKKTN